MEEKLYYDSPECEVVLLQTEGCIAASAPDFPEEELFI